MVKLVDRILKLTVQYSSIRYDNHGLKNLFVLAIVETREPMRQPCDGVGFAGTRTVLNEVVVTWSILPHIRQQFCYHVQLMVSRENQPLGFDRSGLSVTLHL